MLDDFATQTTAYTDEASEALRDWPLLPATVVDYPSPEPLTLQAPPCEVAAPPLPPIPPNLVIKSGRHRRSEPRYLAVETRLWMQWWQGDEYLGRGGVIVNVSRHGAMLVSSFLFREGQMVRIWLEDPEPIPGVDCLILGVVEGLHGMHQVRVKFRVPCSDAFFETAANGFESWQAKQREQLRA